MNIFLGVVGLVFGAMIGDFWGALILGAIGVWLGNWIRRNDEARKARRSGEQEETGAGTGAARLFDDFDSLRAEVLLLRRRCSPCAATGGRP